MTRQIGTRLSKKVAQKERAKNPIQQALGKLEGIDTLRDALEEDRKVIKQMQDVITSLANDQHEMLQDMAAIPFLVHDVNGLIYENVKQRAVNLKIMKAVADGPKFLISGAGRSFSMDQLTQMAEDYSVEYDFVYAFIALAENYRPRNEESLAGVS